MYGCRRSSPDPRRSADGFDRSPIQDDELLHVLIVCLLLVRTVLYLVAEIGNRSGGLGPEEIDRRERAPGAAAGMERMPSPSRARYSYCQPLCRPGPTPPRGPGSRLAPCCSDLGSSCCVATGASGAADAETPPPRLEGSEGGGGGGEELARARAVELCHAVAEMDDTHAARGRRLLQAPRTCHLIIF